MRKKLAAKLAYIYPLTPKTQMSKHPNAAVVSSANAGMKMSPEARTGMRRQEKEVFNYYDDMGPGKGNCTWGVGILAHKGVCTKKELAKPVSAAAIESEFSRRVAAAEAGAIRNVSKQKLPQDQFDALVSLTFNAGVNGSRRVYALIESDRPAEAALQIQMMTSTHVNGKKVLARGLIARRAQESAPFKAAAKLAAAGKK